jgi:hypothetical protein
VEIQFFAYCIVILSDRGIFHRNNQKEDMMATKAAKATKILIKKIGIVNLL